MTQLDTLHESAPSISLVLLAPVIPISVAVLPALPPAAEPLAAPDPYYGLLTDPVGEWGLIGWGDDHALILKGGDQFRRRSLNLLHSFVGDGAVKAHQDPFEQSAPFSKGIHIKEKDAMGNCMVPISKERLTQGLALWFYGRVYSSKAQTRDILDEEGDFLDIEVLNEGAMESEADVLAAAFVESIRGTSLGCRFTGWGHDTPVTDYWTGSLGAAHSTGDGREGD